MSHFNKLHKRVNLVLEEDNELKKLSPKGKLKIYSLIKNELKKYRNQQKVALLNYIFKQFGK